MKRLAVIVAVAAVPVLACLGQSAPTNQVAVVQDGRRSSIEQAPPFIAPATNRVPYFIRKRATYEGVVPRAVRAKNPLQLLNPFAPASYGSGWNNVVINPSTGRAEGVAVFAIEF